MRLAVGITTMSASAPPETRMKRSRMGRSFSLFSAPPMGTIQPRVSPGEILLGIQLSASSSASATVRPVYQTPLGARSRQQLNPVQAMLGRLPRLVGDAHFGESRVHDVFAVSGAVEPASDHLVG